MAYIITEPLVLTQATLKACLLSAVTIATSGFEMTVQSPPATTPEPSPNMSPRSSSTAATSPAADSHDDDDIWGEADGDHTTEEVLSDLPSMKRQHMTDGYREGLSIGKARVMQSGFDEGYPIGVKIAMRVGPILGVLEAYLACKSIEAIPGMRHIVKSTYDDALHDLSISNLLDNQDEKTLLASKTIPEAAETIISFWEGKVTAVYETRRSTMAIQEQENPHELREVVEEAKRKDTARFNSDHTEKNSQGPVVQKEGFEENTYRRRGQKPVW